MIALLQRVSRAQVRVNGAVVGAIGSGILAFVGVEKSDSQTEAQRLFQRMVGYRVFEDADGKMNLSLTQIGGGLLLVPQFTLVADTGKGMRPSFSSAADPALGRTIFGYLTALAQGSHSHVASGLFGAHMAVELVNDGPVTFHLRVPPAAGRGSPKAAGPPKGRGEK